MPSRERPVVIYRAATPQHAALLRNLLEDEGIDAWIQNDFLQGAAGDLPLGWRGDAEVAVRESEGERARDIALKFDERLRSAPSIAATSNPNTSSIEIPNAEPWDNWPRCPQCNERRMTQCPTCSATSTQFPLADLDMANGNERPLLVCQECDEPFEPQFFVTCHGCGHDFPTGLAVEQPAAPATKVIVVLVAVAAAGTALGVYFWRLLTG